MGVIYANLLEFLRQMLVWQPLIILIVRQINGYLNLY